MRCVPHAAADAASEKHLGSGVERKKSNISRGPHEGKGLSTSKSSLKKIRAFKQEAPTGIIADPCIPPFMYKDNGSKKEIRSNHDALIWILLTA